MLQADSSFSESLAPSSASSSPPSMDNTTDTSSVSTNSNSNHRTFSDPNATTYSDQSKSGSCMESDADGSMRDTGESTSSSSRSFSSVDATSDTCAEDGSSSTSDSPSLLRLLCISIFTNARHWDYMNGKQKLAEYARDMIAAARTEKNATVGESIAELLVQDARGLLGDKPTECAMLKFILDATKSDNPVVKIIALHVAAHVPELGMHEACSGCKSMKRNGWDNQLKEFFELMIDDQSVRTKAIEYWTKCLHQYQYEEVYQLRYTIQKIIKLCEGNLSTDTGAPLWAMMKLVKFVDMDDYEDDVTPIHHIVAMRFLEAASKETKEDKLEEIVKAIQELFNRYLYSEWTPDIWIEVAKAVHRCSFMNNKSLKTIKSISGLITGLLESMDTVVCPYLAPLMPFVFSNASNCTKKAWAVKIAFDLINIVPDFALDHQQPIVQLLLQSMTEERSSGHAAAAFALMAESRWKAPAVQALESLCRLLAEQQNASTQKHLISAILVIGKHCGVPIELEFDMTNDQFAKWVEQAETDEE